MKDRFSHYSTYIFDLDGCIHFSGKVAQGAAELVRLLQEKGRRVVFMSNNSTHSPADIVSALKGMGIDTDEDSVALASTITGSYLLKLYGKTKVCLAGTENLAQEMERFGHTCVPVEEDEKCPVLLLGRDTGFTMNTLRRCAWHLRNGTEFFSTNIDRYHPRDDGTREPETGALAAAVKAVTGRNPKVATKPKRFAFDYILEQTGAERSKCLMVGDNPYTDVAGALSAGIDICWLTNNTTQYPDNQDEAHIVYASVEELYRAISEYFTSSKPISN